MAIFVLVVLCSCLAINLIVTIALLKEYEKSGLIFSIIFIIALILAIIFQSINL